TNLLTWSTLINLVDILVVWYVIYRLIMLVRGTKAVQLLKGVFVIAAIKIISWFLQLKTVGYLTDLVITWSVPALVIIFQPEIRRGLEH
ncbi:TIGR00159 family protein, partial [Lacticaseibacillus paracasei]